MLYEDLRGRIEVFDTVAGRYTDIVVDRERAGVPIGMADARIAAICAARRAVSATRDIKDFVGAGIELVDPWRYETDRHG